MSPHKNLLLAIDLATREREKAQAQLQQARQADVYAKGQMQQLEDYLQETEQRWLRGARTSASPELLQHHYQFTSRLNQAIVLQRGVLHSASRRVEAAQQQLLQIEIRLASFKKLLAKRQALQTERQQRREQRQADEFAGLQTQRQQRMRVETGL